MQEKIKFFFGNLPEGYYLKHFLVGLLISILLGSSKGFSFQFIFLATINTLLYPYSRFVYKKLYDYIPSEKTMLFEIIATLICFGVAILIAPIGLIYLHFNPEKNYSQVE